MNTVVVVGNPKLGSRTRQAGELVVERLTGAPPNAVIEVAGLGPALLGWGDPAVEAAKQVVRDAGLVLFASPTYKATYTGLLKLFLDQFTAGELHGRTAVALMLGAAPEHALAGELTLKPVLSEIGCSCPTPALYLLESTWEDSPELDAWLERARDVLG
ncbi:MAG TPA: NAD(P)H-dependent oxidoreductase [Acidimicrobiales bacterium]